MTFGKILTFAQFWQNFDSGCAEDVRSVVVGAALLPRGRRVPPSHHVGEGPAPARAAPHRPPAAAAGFGSCMPASVPGRNPQELLARRRLPASARWSRPSGPTAGAAGAPLLKAAPASLQLDGLITARRPRSGLAWRRRCPVPHR